MKYFKYKYIRYDKNYESIGRVLDAELNIYNLLLIFVNAQPALNHLSSTKYLVIQCLYKGEN